MSIAQLKKVRPQIFTFDEENGVSLIIVGRKGKQLRLLIKEQDTWNDNNLTIEVVSKSEGVMIHE